MNDKKLLLLLLFLFICLIKYLFLCTCRYYGIKTNDGETRPGKDTLGAQENDS